MGASAATVPAGLSGLRRVRSGIECGGCGETGEKPALGAGNFDLTRSPAGYLVQRSTSNQVDDRPGTLTAEASDLGERDGRVVGRAGACRIADRASTPGPRRG